MITSIQRPGLRLLFLGLVILAHVTACADEPTPRERELMAIVQRLEARISALEEGKPESSGDALSERVEALETQVERQVSPAPNDFRVFWKNGLNLETTDGTTQLKIGGRIHNDWFWFDQDRALQRMADQEDGAEFRRARLYLGGTLYENLVFKGEYDFAGGDADFKDVHLELRDIPGIQNLRVGHFKEPFSLQELSSDNDIPLMERALPGIFAPSYNTGAMLHGAFLGAPKAERLTAAAGLFRTADDFGNNSDDGGYAGTVRVTGLPWYADGGRKLIHLGAGYTHRNVDGTLRIRQRPEAHGADRFLDTGEFDVDTVDSFVLEGALGYGAFNLQGEYFSTSVDTENAGERHFDGFYAQASYLLTGEHRAYKNEGGVFGGVVPNRNLKWRGEDRGWGAWEVALRYSTIDLDDGRDGILDRAFERTNQIRGGEEDNVSLGLNWYLNPNARIMWNYVHANIESDVYDGDLNIFQTRFQLAF